MTNSPIVARINAILAEKSIPKQNFYSSCGITSASYSMWNTGKTQPRMKNLETIAEFLGVSVAYLLEGVSEKKNDDQEQKEKPTLQTESERIPGYSKLSETNRAIVDSMIAQLLAAQSED